MTKVFESQKKYSEHCYHGGGDTERLAAIFALYVSKDIITGKYTSNSKSRG